MTILPRPTVDSAPFWEACRRGALLLQRCARCGQHRFPPAPLCPECWSSEATWAQASGRGQVVTHVTFRRAYAPVFAGLVPYTVAIVELADLQGRPRLLTRLVAVAPEAVRVGLPVEVVFDQVSDTVSLPLFRPAAPAEPADDDDGARAGGRGR